MPDRLFLIVLYMSGPKSTILGIKREIRIACKEQWYVLHLDAVIACFVHPTTGMLLCCPRDSTIAYPCLDEQNTQ